MFLSPFIFKKTNEESFHGCGVGFGEGMGTVNPADFMTYLIFL